MQLCYFNNVENIVKDSIRKIYVESNLYYEDPEAAAKVVCNFTRGTEQISWKARYILNSIAPNKWGNIIFAFNVPKNLKKDDKIKIFIKNTSKSTIYIDGFTMYMQ